jgi:murein DD-endopeptidase MepM/ murein hydrolase activator NlpD
VTANAGGPFIPVSAVDAAADRLSSRMMLAWQTLGEFDQVKKQIDRLPIYLPMKTVERISSGFGLRRDPFRRSLAVHSGVDFKASLASEVIAVSDGVVTFAGWSGAYGRMIEISHDNGVSTRYAHLSSIKVSPGASVKRGEVIGRMGSTGRSTGPHLHYETRVDGRAIDPVRFWQAFNDLQTLKSKER